jgi:putative transposase
VDTSPKKGNLPRLKPQNYSGYAVVFWTNTLEERSRGWLTEAFHSRFREITLHAAVRENLICPAYCLMPDHLHLVWMGLRRESNQLNAMKFLRTQLEPALGSGRKWQHQPHDHVLREEERKRGAFASFCFYTLANPVRAELVKSEKDWPYYGALIPGYPNMNPMVEGYWEKFWKLYVKQREAEMITEPGKLS